MKQTIVDYEEYLFCKFNHKGNTLAAGGNSGLISLFTVTEQHQLKAFETKLDHESAVGFFSWSPDDRLDKLKTHKFPNIPWNIYINNLRSQTFSAILDVLLIQLEEA